MNWEDTYQQKGLRKKLMDTIRNKDIASTQVLTAMEHIPRHIFADKALLTHIYEDKALPIANGQTISQPSTVAYQSTLLSLAPDDIVLEIGTGSGYQTLILAQLCKYVLSIERQLALFKKAKTMIKQFPYRNIELFYGDGYKGLVHYAPFDKILVTCGAPDIPEKLVKQLKPGGRMVIPVGPIDCQSMIIVDKIAEGDLKITKGKTVKFVPMLHGTNRK